MKLISLLICLFIGFSASNSSFALPPEQQQVIVDELSKGSWKFRADLLSKEEQKWLTDYILTDKASSPSLPSDAYDGVLLQLAHEPTIQKHGAKIRTGAPDYNQISHSRQPRLLEFFEGYLMIAEPAVPSERSGDIPPQSESAGIAWKMMELLKDCGEIPAETRVWALNLENVFQSNLSMNPSNAHVAATDEARNIVRNWWKENKAAFNAREFDKVKPGATHSQLSAGKAEEPENPAVALPGVPVKTAVASEPSTSDSEKPSDRIWPGVLVASLLLLLAIGLVVFARSHKAGR